MQKLLFILLFFPLLLSAQVDIYVHQTCRQSPIGVINHPELEGKSVDAQTLLFTIPLTAEPTRISFHVDTAGFMVERLWVDTSVRRMDLWIYNCKAWRSRVENANLLTKEERANNLYFDYLAQKLEDREAYTKAFNDFLKAYIREHPASFLSLNYVSKLTASDAEMANLLTILEPANGHYPTFQKMKNRLLYKGKVKAGEPVPDFEGVDLQGQPFSSKDLHHAATVLMFWHSGCSWSRKVMPAMNAIQQKRAGEDVEFVFFSLDENKALWEETAAQLHIGGRNISDLQGLYGKVPLELGITATPYFIVLDKERKVRLCTFGDEAGLVETELLRILGGQ